MFIKANLQCVSGNFRAGPTPGTILKKVCTAEELAFKALMKDRLKPYVPDYKGQITSEEGDCILSYSSQLTSIATKKCHTTRCSLLQR